jgi:hypothetical protein
MTSKMIMQVIVNVAVFVFILFTDALFTAEVIQLRLMWKDDYE